MGNFQFEHSEMVRELRKPGDEIVPTLTPEKADILHMTSGLAGESGELIDVLKKHVFYEKPLDFKKVVEEMGDIEFYLEGLRQALSISRSEVLVHNVSKLRTRYPNKVFSNKDAVDRKDKA